MQHLEVESKFELTASDFERLKSLGHVSRCADQLNVYYDEQWRLADSSSTLRIRFDDHSGPVLTLKVPVSHVGEKRVMREFEIKLAHQPASQLGSPHPTAIDVTKELPAELSEYLLVLGVRQLQRMGWVRNTRLVLDVHGVGTVELDKLELPDGSVVYEAEIESDSSPVHDSVVSWVCLHAPEARPSRISKFQRFRIAASSMTAAVLSGRGEE